MVTTVDADVVLTSVEELRPVLESTRDSNEQDRRLDPRAFEAMRDLGLYRAWLPEALGDWNSR